MQKAVFLVGIICLLLGLSYFGNGLRSIYQDNKEILDPIVGLQNPSKTFKNSIEIPYQGKTLLVTYLIVEKPSSISLYSNLEKQQNARDLYKEKNCQALVSGGFYSKEQKHIGAFISEGETINPSSKNTLFNGVFSMEADKAQISEQISTDTVRFAVQSGPILIKDKQLQTLNVKEGEGERRVNVGVTHDNKVVFLAFFQKDSAYLGPKLGDLPGVVKQFEDMTGTLLVSALNLDGGTASAFITQDISLGELSKIGSYFCLR